MIKKKDKKEERKGNDEEEKKEKDTKDEDNENKEEEKDEKGGEIVLSGKGKKKLIKKVKKDEEENENGTIQIPEIDFDYNALRQKNIENYEVVDQNHYYRSRPKLRGMLNMKEIREMFNINVPNEENKININNYQDSERGPFYKQFINDIGQAQSQKIIGKSYISKIIDSSEKETLIQSVNHNFFGVGTKSTVQVLRSVDDWCTGMDQVENSILKAYYRLIENSKHYIFIENQFFVSKSYDKSEEQSEAGKKSISSIVNNEIAFRIRKRIERAYFAKEKFRVFIFIPLLPGFAGEPDEGTIQIILGHTYAGICRNNGLSIIEELNRIMGDKWRDYIGFYSLRGHGVLNGVPVTELIYIHSKLMIVDDESVIIGSANINDRSMLGTRDSEFCVLINETLKFSSIMDGEECKTAKFAVTLRKALMAEHLGLDADDDILIDPLSDKLLELFKDTAKNNTLIYRKLFRCYPDDEMKTFKDTKKCPKIPFVDKEEIEKLQKMYIKEKNSIKGHIVEFPLHFLEKEVLGAGFLGIYSLVPEHNFT
jgi:phosphatidylserine/phosphatidylglycerophosphate/cardiolipin synthase-like enzyme